MRSFKALATLVLDWNSIGDEGLAALADAVVQLPCFRVIRLCSFCRSVGNNEVTAAGAKALALALERSKSLTRIDLRTNCLTTSGEQDRGRRRGGVCGGD